MKYLVAAIAALATFLTNAADVTRLPNEPMDFGGVAWGANFGDFPDQFRLVRQDDDVKVYKRNAEVVTVGQADLMKVAYRFYKDRFSAGIIQTYGAGNSRALRESLRSKHGEPRRLSKRQEIDLWEGEHMVIVLSCSVTTYCAAEYVSREVIAQEEKDTGKPIEILNRDDDD